MGKQRKSDSREPDDIYAHSAGAIGLLVMVTAGLMAIKTALGISWPAAVALTVGALIAIGYAAWWVKTRVTRWWAREPAETPSAVLAQESQPDGADEQAVPVHPELTAVLTTAAAIGKEQVIRADEVTSHSVSTGTLYDFLVPKGRTYEDVEKRLGTVAGMFGVTRLHMKIERSRDNERRVRLLKLNEPPFTHAFPAPTRQEISTFAGVPLGHDVTGQLAGVPTFDKASLLVAGMTQMGKTTLINGLITCLLIAYGEFELYLLDGKFCGLTRFEGIATRYESSDDPAVFWDMVRELNARSDSRYREITEAIRNRKPAPKFKPIIFIVDESADFFASGATNEEKERARNIAEDTRRLVSKSLESGISTILMTQRPSANAIPVEVRDQFLYRMCLYVASSGTAKVALGDTYFETVAPINPALLDPDIPGQAVLFVKGRSTLIRGFDFPDQFIWGVVDSLNDTRKAAEPEQPPLSPVEQAIKLLRDKSVTFMATADLAAFFGLDPDGKDLAVLLGVSPNRTSKARGYRLADLEAAARTRV
ncbi:FtsK/SpoIIIE domain-containing protein [Streptomyces sp. NPDC058621]|uniref:FtsK/SpoIIIE domain-containing protein n=1 Tax=Streptomyces sp. NPDC058621 TaxID=3346561 RepID=UPI00365A5141